MTRVLAFSDLHGSQPAAEALVARAAEADLVVGAGDFCNFRRGLDEVMDWLEPLAGKAVYVCGNHENAAELADATHALVLHGNGVERAGLRLWGLGGAVPVQSPRLDWSYELDEDEAGPLLGAMAAVDILLSHSPPAGAADRSRQGVSRGSTALAAAINRVRPRFCLCGHIHDSWGLRERLGETEVLNLGPAGVVLEV